MPTTVAITGASGFLGQALIAHAPAGVEIVTLGRHASDRPFDMQRPAPIDLTNVHAVIHAAWILAPRTPAVARLNIAASTALLAAAATAHARFVFVSSMSASASARSTYGSAKRAVEQAVLAYGNGVVIRPGIIRDESGNTGMLDATLARVAGLPVAVTITPDPAAPLVGLDRVVDAIWTQALTAAASEPIELVDEWSTLNALVDRQRDPRQRPTARVPAAAMGALMGIARHVPVGLARDAADSWLGLTDAGANQR